MDRVYSSQLRLLYYIASNKYRHDIGFPADAIPRPHATLNGLQSLESLMHGVFSSTTTQQRSTAINTETYRYLSIEAIKSKHVQEAQWHTAEKHNRYRTTMPPPQPWQQERSRPFSPPIGSSCTSTKDKVNSSESYQSYLDFIGQWIKITTAISSALS